MNPLENIPYTNIFFKEFSIDIRTKDLGSRILSALLIPERDIIIIHGACLLLFCKCAPK